MYINKPEEGRLQYCTQQAVEFRKQMQYSTVDHQLTIMSTNDKTASQAKILVKLCINT